VKKSLIGIAAIATLIATPALAADMALKAPPAEIWSWTGFYIGANAGDGWASTEWLNNHISTCPGNALFTVSSCPTGSQSSNSFIGGGQIGARVQTGQFVFGIEGTADYANFHASTLDPQAFAQGFTIFDGTQLRGLYTATGQVGAAWDRSLWYVKGGFAGSSLTQTSTAIAGPTFGAVSHLAYGWTVGTGLDYRVTRNVSVGLEYDYIRLYAGNASTCTTGAPSVFSCPAPTTPLMFTNFHANANELLIRASYNFNWAVSH